MDVLPSVSPRLTSISKIFHFQCVKYVFIKQKIKTVNLLVLTVSALRMALSLKTEVFET